MLVGVTGYYIYRDGVNIVSSAAAAYEDTLTDIGVNHTYKVRAYNDASLESAFSNEVTVSIPAPAPSPAPAPTAVAAPRKEGDVNRDGRINVYDLSLMVSSWGAVNDKVSDLNRDGKTNIYDLSLLISNWGE